MKMKFKFDNNETLTLDVFDTETNQRVLELCKECKTNNIELYQRPLPPEIGRSYSGHWLTKTPIDALENLRKGFKLTGIEPAVTIGDSLTIEECNIIHRQFTTAFNKGGYNTQDLQLINHSIHDYEDSLVTPNYMDIQATVGNDNIFGFDVTHNQQEYAFHITEEDILDITSDVYLNDECRVGRSFEEAWAHDDNPSNSDIMDIDSVGPLFLFQNERRKKLYSSDVFHNWLEKYNSTEKKYSDIPFANIVDGNYGNITTATLVDITW
jgi:hypothetical protein